MFLKTVTLYTIPLVFKEVTTIKKTKHPKYPKYQTTTEQISTKVKMLYAFNNRYGSGTEKVTIKCMNMCSICCYTVNIVHICSNKFTFQVPVTGNT